MERRDYLSAVAGILGVSLAGCADISTMSKEEAKQQFDDVQEFESPHYNYDDAVRCVDEEAGIVLYAMSVGGSSHAGKGVGLTSVPLSETNLDE